MKTLKRMMVRIGVKMLKLYKQPILMTNGDKLLNNNNNNNNSSSNNNNSNNNNNNNNNNNIIFAATTLESCQRTNPSRPSKPTSNAFKKKRQGEGGAGSNTRPRGE